MTELTPQLRERIDNTIRFLAADAVVRANSGHQGAPMGLARAAFELWDRHLRFDPADPAWPLRDRFVLSAGHASMLQYALLHLFGFRVSMEDLQSFRQLGSITPGHPEYGDTPGVELTTGPLGQGFAHGVGMALAGRIVRSRFGRDGEGPGHHFVYGVVSDGDVMEGVSSEAASFAGHLGLGNLIYLYDDNRVTIDGPTDLTFSEDVGRRFEAYAWHVEHVDGQDAAALRAALERARAETARPSLVVLRTTIGYGSPNVAGKAAAHGFGLDAEEVKRTKQALGWPVDSSFLVPDDVRAYLEERIEAKRGERARADRRLDAWRAAHPDAARGWDDARERRWPADLGARLAEGLEGVDNPTRKHSAAVLERLSHLAPWLVGGSADLAGSGAPPVLKDAGVIGQDSDPFAGANVHFGVREHAMAAIANGIGLDGTFQPFCGTFLVFSDYMRPSLRLAALMGVRTLFVFTHDSIFVGEDGPTHQPIEHVDALRAIPGLTVFRPADGVETAMSYAWALQQGHGPVAMCYSRQKVAALRREAPFELEDVYRGAYAVRDPGAGTHVVLLASGSEVSLACDAAAKLSADGIEVRVVSVPCIELFLARPEQEREALVPQDGTPLVAVEAGRGQAFRGLVGPKGLVYGIDRFGASAPYTVLAEHFGFTPDALARRVKEFLGRG